LGQKLRTGNRKIKLLIVSVGSLVGQNILDALEFSEFNRRDLVHITGTNSLALTPNNFRCDECYLVPPTASDEYPEKMREIIKTVNPDLIIPCRDEDVAFISELSENCPDLQGKLLCGTKEVALAILDKGISSEFSEIHGLPFAPSIYCNAGKIDIDQFISEHGFPIIAKPVSGFASKGIYILYKKEQLEKFLNRDDYIFQKYLSVENQVWNYLDMIESGGIPLFHTFEDEKISIQALIGPNGSVGALFATLHQMDYGKSSVVTICNDRKVLEKANEWAKIFSSAGWRGPLNIQCQRNQEGNLLIYEYNGRFTGATSARTALGFDEVGIILGLWLENSFPLHKNKTGSVRVNRVPLSKILDDNNVQTLKKSGYWSF